MDTETLMMTQIQNTDVDSSVLDGLEPLNGDCLLTIDGNVPHHSVLNYNHENLPQDANYLNTYTGDATHIKENISGLSMPPSSYTFLVQNTSVPMPNILHLVPICSNQFQLV